MKNNKILFVSQEITPYLDENEMSRRGRVLPQEIQERGNEIRTFMPRFGVINERRNQLHEVIRLSGMNIIIDDTDHPLIIKVASIQAARMQVYFIENEDYFQRKHVLTDEKGKPFTDNDERAIFFARGVLETVKKLRWSPDIVYCQGWFSALLPLYLKRVYHDDPIFTQSKVVYSVYNDMFKGDFGDGFEEKFWLKGIEKKDMDFVKKYDWNGIMQLALHHSDAVIYGNKDIPASIRDFVHKEEKPVLEYQEDQNFADAYASFFKDVLKGEIHVS
ncbi:MAG: glycogen/starch synthase [Chlorobi bacterium]|nr:glycogen/starch synthase [Chlorobiota bacterium]